MRVGILGCGHIARFHLNTLKTMDGTEIVGVCDVKKENLEKISEEYNISNTYASLDQLIKKSKPDVIHVLAPPSTHKDLSIKAMNAGCHVLVEKPMAESVKDANEMIEASEKNNVKLCVGHSHAFGPVARKAQEIVNSYEFGDLVHLDSFFIFDTNRLKHLSQVNGKTPGHWVHGLKGGLLQDLASHPLSLALKFLSEIKDVHTIAKKFDSKSGFINDEIRVLIDSETTTASISMSLRAKPDNVILNLYGTKMTLKVDVSNMLLVKQQLFKSAKKFSRGVDNLVQSFQISTQTINNVVKFAIGRLKNADGLGYVIREFHKSIGLDTLPPVTGQEGARVVELINKIWN